MRRGRTSRFSSAISESSECRSVLMSASPRVGRSWGERAWTSSPGRLSRRKQCCLRSTLSSTATTSFPVPGWNNASLFAPTGLTAGRIEQPEKILVRRIDLSYALLPWQPALRNGKALSEKYGERVGYSYSEAEDGGIFWSNDPAMPIARMVRELDLEGEGAAVDRSRKLQDLVRGGQPSEL